MGDSVADVVNPFKGWNDFFIVGHDDDGRVKLFGHLIEDANYSQGAFAVKWRSRFISKNHGWAVDQPSCNRHPLLLAA